MLNLLKLLPKFFINVHVLSRSQNILMINIMIVSVFNWNYRVHNSDEMFVIFLLNTDCEYILNFENFCFQLNKSFAKKRFFNLIKVLYLINPLLFVKVYNYSWLRSEYLLAFFIRQMILPSDYKLIIKKLDLHLFQLPNYN